MKRQHKQIAGWKTTALACMMLAGVPMAACSDTKSGAESSTPDEDEGRPTKALRELMRTIDEGDASGFAALCTYPILREYPLKDIDDAEMMVDYFPVIVDDSLRNIMKESNIDDWVSYGWRGWSLSECQPLWFDGGIEIINYESKAERGLRNILAREEIMTLLPEYREGWTPVATLIEADGDRIFRIDVNNDTYRLMGFDNADVLKKAPGLLLTGKMKTEGSAALRHYAFSDSTGTNAVYMPDGELPLRIWLTRPKTQEETIKVHSGYWRDILR